jgi:hypothetical protein
MAVRYSRDKVMKPGKGGSTGNGRSVGDAPRKHSAQALRSWAEGISRAQ